MPHHHLGEEGKLVVLEHDLREYRTTAEGMLQLQRVQAQPADGMFGCVHVRGRVTRQSSVVLVAQHLFCYCLFHYCAVVVGAVVMTRCGAFFGHKPPDQTSTKLVLQVGRDSRSPSAESQQRPERQPLPYPCTQRG